MIIVLLYVYAFCGQASEATDLNCECRKPCSKPPFGMLDLEQLTRSKGMKVVTPVRVLSHRIYVG